MGNSIEEYVEILERFSNENVIYGSTVGMTLEKYKDLQLSTEHILSDYKRVLKENEILKEEKEQAWEEWNNLEQGSYETEQKIKQQIKKLQKENEELKLKERRRIIGKYGEFEIHDVINRTLSNDYIPVQEVKDKIEKEKLPLVIIGGRKNKKTLEYGIKLGRRQALRELIEERED